MIPQTSVISESELFPNQGLFSLSSGLNLLYPNPSNPEFLSYWMFTLEPRYSDAGVDDLREANLQTQFRTLKFRGEGKNSIIVFNDPAKGNCLWVLNSFDRYNPYISSLTRRFLPVSNLSRILPAQDVSGYPPEEFFGVEPAHGWCYQFENAELALQQKDWNRLNQIADEVSASGYSLQNNQSNSPREWLPFIIGYGYQGRWSDALQLTLDSFNLDHNYRRMLCDTWKTLDRETDVTIDKGNAVHAINTQLACRSGPIPE